MSSPVTRDLTIGMGESIPNSAILCRSCAGLALDPMASTGTRPSSSSYTGRSSGSSRSPSSSPDSRGHAPGYSSGSSRGTPASPSARSVRSSPGGLDTV